MDELKLTGNCLKGSRPLLSFDKVRNDDILYHGDWKRFNHAGSHISFCYLDF